MNERELSKLSYLVQALVNAPERYKHILQLAQRENLSPPSDELNQAIAALQAAFEIFSQGPTSDPVMRLKQIVRQLESSTEPSAKSAARSLAWVLQNRSDARVTA